MIGEYYYRSPNLTTFNVHKRVMRVLYYLCTTHDTRNIMLWQ